MPRYYFNLFLSRSSWWCTKYNEMSFLQEEGLCHYIQLDQPLDSSENRRRSARGADGEVEPEPGSIVRLEVVFPLSSNFMSKTSIQSCTTVFTSHNLSCEAVCTFQHPYRDQWNGDNPIPSTWFVFFENSLPFYQLNISCTDIPFVLENGVVGGGRSSILTVM